MTLRLTVFIPPSVCIHYFPYMHYLEGSGDVCDRLADRMELVNIIVCVYCHIFVKLQNLQWAALPENSNQQCCFGFCSQTTVPPPPVLGFKLHLPQFTFICVIFFPGQVSFYIQVAPSFFFTFLSVLLCLSSRWQAGEVEWKHTHTHTFLDHSHSANTFFCVHSKLTHVLPMAYFLT